MFKARKRLDPFSKLEHSSDLLLSLDPSHQWQTPEVEITPVVVTDSTLCSEPATGVPHILRYRHDGGRQTPKMKPAPNAFSYSALSEAPETRLLRVLPPMHDGDQDIRCSFETILDLPDDVVDTVPLPSYISVSYVWGEPGNEKSI